MIVGYARISDKSQEIGTQIEQLKNYGCQRIEQEVVSGVSKDKTLNELVESLEKGDTLVATRVDRLGRSAYQVLELANKLKEKEVHLVILDLGVDTRTIGGELILTFMAAIAQWERENNLKKQRNGIELARKRNKHLGRKAEWSRAGLEDALKEYIKGEKSVNEISEIYNIPRSTLYHYIRKAELTR